MLACLVAARKDSKYLAGFLIGYLTHTNGKNTELFVMLNKEDTWNKNVVKYFSKYSKIHFYYENKKMGRAGLHIYFNMLYNKANNPAWTIYFCEDHQFVFDNWDIVVFNKIERLDLNPYKPYCLIPKFDNVGAMNQILSRGYIKALGGVLGQHGNIDSYINDINRGLPIKLEKELVVKFDEEMFHDYTHDIPLPIDHPPSDAPNAYLIPKYSSHVIQDLIKLDSLKIKEAWNEKN